MYKKIFSIIFAALCICGNAMAQGTADLVINDITAAKGETVTVPVTMTGVASGFQFAVYPPEGVTLQKVSRGDAVKLRDDSDEYIFTFQSAERPNGGRFVLCYSIGVPTQEAGVVANLTFVVGEDVAPGTYDIVMKDAECAHGTNILSTYKERTSTLTVTAATAIKGLKADQLLEDVKVYNTAGQLIKSVEGSQTAGEITKQLNSGSYILKSDKGTFKVVK